MIRSRAETTTIAGNFVTIIVEDGLQIGNSILGNLGSRSANPIGTVTTQNTIVENQSIRLRNKISAEILETDSATECWLGIEDEPDGAKATGVLGGYDFVVSRQVILPVESFDSIEDGS